MNLASIVIAFERQADVVVMIAAVLTLLSGADSLITESVLSNCPYCLSSRMHFLCKDDLSQCVLVQIMD
jgi:hypothetical protein